MKPLGELVKLEVAFVATRVREGLDECLLLSLQVLRQGEDDLWAEIDWLLGNQVNPDRLGLGFDRKDFRSSVNVSLGISKGSQ